MASQLKIIQGDKSKGKSTSKVHQALEELDFLVTFNRSITQAMARTMQDLSDGVFINIANFTLTQLSGLYQSWHQTGHPECSQDCPLHTSALFPDHLISKAEEEIRHHENKRTPSSSKGSQRFHPYSQSGRQQQPDQDRKSGLPAWKQLGRRAWSEIPLGQSCFFLPATC